MRFKEESLFCSIPACLLLSKLKLRSSKNLFMISYFSILKYSDQIIFNVMYVVLLLLINFIFFQIEEFRLNLDEKGAEPEKVRSFDHAGHRSDVRTVAFSSDNTAIVSASHESIKIWNRASVVS